MKAWRKHNQKQTALIQELSDEIAWYPTNSEQRKLIQQNIDRAKGLKLRNKTERRGQYAAEVATPSYLLLALLQRIDLWTPA
jgi:Fe-S cluster biosynthesis and repair protein YggX